MKKLFNIFVLTTLASGSIAQTTFFTEDFNDGIGDWVAEIQEGSVGFEITNIGHENDPANTFQIPTLDTEGMWMLLDSDGDGTSYANPEASTLTSPELDLSAAAGTYVALNFIQFFAEWQPAETEDHCFIGISTDGLTFTEVEINEGVGREARPNPEEISWDISDIIAGSESSVWIRFRWEGAWNYGWQFDNVKIEEINESDFKITDTYRLNDNGIVYSKLPENHIRNFNIGAIIKNTGHIDQTNIRFEYSITAPDGSEVASGTSSESIASLSNGQQDTLFHDTGYSADQLGYYNITWNAISDNVDDFIEDNTISDNHFELTEYNMALDYDEGEEKEIDNWPLKTGEAYFGNLMTFTNEDVATAMEVKITNHNEILGEQIKVAIWEFPEGGSEWTLVYDSDDHTIIEENLGNMVTFDIEEFSVNTTSTYMFCGYQYSSAPKPIFVKQGDIGFNNVQGKDDEFNNRGFFDRNAPIIRVRLFEGEVGIDTDNDFTNDLFIYPNPAREIINIELSSGLENSETGNIIISDVSGKIVDTILATNSIQVDLNHYEDGIYFVEYTNNNIRIVRKFIIK